MEVDPTTPAATASCRSRTARVRDYAYKPDEPRGQPDRQRGLRLPPGPVLDVLEELADEAGDDGLEDLGDELLPRLVDAGRRARAPLRRLLARRRARSTPTGRPQELLGDPSRRSTSTTRPGPCSPRRRRTGRRARARRGAGRATACSARRARVAGDVERSVIGRGAVVEAGAVVRESVLLPGAVVRAGATVERRDPRRRRRDRRATRGRRGRRRHRPGRPADLRCGPARGCPPGPATRPPRTDARARRRAPRRALLRRRRRGGAAAAGRAPAPAPPPAGRPRRPTRSSPS